MVRIKEIGGTLNVFINGTPYSLENVESAEKKLIYKYGVLFNKLQAPHLLTKLIGIVDKKQSELTKQEDALKVEKKRLEHYHSKLDYSVRKHFSIRKGALRIRGLDIDFPINYLEVINRASDKGYNLEAIKNFLQLLALNPSKYIRDNLFDFFIANNFPITENGYIVALRRVWLYGAKGRIGADERTRFSQTERESILSAYALVKARKKSPSNFYLSTDSKPTTVPNGRTLQELKEDLESQLVSSDQWYTDNYTKSFKWYLQTICDKPRGEAVGHENSDCSGGFFHLGSKDHVLQGTSYGNIILLCLVNPTNCTNIPQGQTWKFGTCEFFPVAEISENDVQEIFKNPFDVLGTIDEDYERLDLFDIPVGVEFTITENAKLKALAKKLAELKESINLYNDIPATDFKELSKLVEGRIIEI